MLDDSRMFHIIARESLCEIVLDSDADSATKKRLINFLMNEASDYQVISLLVDEQLPLNESNFQDEIYTYEMFHAIVESNRDFLEEWMGADFVDSLKKVRPRKIRIFQEKELSAAAQRQQAGAGDRYMNYLKQTYVKDPKGEYLKMRDRVWTRLTPDQKKEFSQWAQTDAPAMRKQVVAQQQPGGPQVRMGPVQRPTQEPEKGEPQQQTQQTQQPEPQQQTQQTQQTQQQPRTQQQTQQPEPQQQVSPQQQAQQVQPQQVSQQQQAQQVEPQQAGVGDAVQRGVDTALAADRTISKVQRAKELGQQGIEKGKELVDTAGKEIGKAKEKIQNVDVKQTAQDIGKKAGEVVDTAKRKGQEVAAATPGAIEKAKEKGKDILYGKKVTPADQSVVSPSQTGQRTGGLVQKGQQLKRDIQQSDVYKKGEEYAKQAGEKARELGQRAADSELGTKILGKKLVKGGTGEISRSGGLLQKAQQAAAPVASAAKQAAVSTMGAFKTAAAKGGVSAGLKAAAMTPGGLAVSGAMLGGLVGFGAWKMYQRFLSAAARNCRGYSGRQKTMCMNKYKIDGLNRQIVELQRGLQACERTKNQIKCKNSINKKVQRVRQKIAKIQGSGPPNQAGSF